jgi:His-Xaa-Ser system radical SAM maturase HxsC
MKLFTRGQASPNLSESIVGRITSKEVPISSRSDYVFMSEKVGKDVSGYAGVLTTEKMNEVLLEKVPSPVVHSAQYLDHLTDGDVVTMNDVGYVRTLHRINSQHNAIFATDRCNSFCLMCSQPPKIIDDSDRIYEHLRLIELMDSSTEELGITGGEPTLMKGDFLRLVNRCKELLPNTALHVLTNGRLFYYGSFAQELAEVDHPDLMLGIPIYSDIDYEHDYVVQARNAFDETMIGLHNLGRYGVRVEIRVVIHKQTFSRLPEIAEFIYRNLPFASHIALMGMELMGFAIPNLEDLWIDPYDYQEELSTATMYLARRGMNVSVYNHQLCVVPEEIWPFCRKSISDWKNLYLGECAECCFKDSCGGFFSSSLDRRHSNYIKPFTTAKRVFSAS